MYSKALLFVTDFDTFEPLTSTERLSTVSSPFMVSSLAEISYPVKLQWASLELEPFNEFFCFVFQSWYKQCYDTAVSSLAEIDYAGGVRPREDRMHGALLVMAELLRCANANWERINRELEELMPAQASSVSAGKDLILELHFVIWQKK